MDGIWDKILSQIENKRVEALEIFDELEEWRLFQTHYCMVLASQTKGLKPGEQTVWTTHANFNVMAEKQIKLPKDFVDPNVNARFAGKASMKFMD